jgi:hypothetical protein
MNETSVGFAMVSPVYINRRVDLTPQEASEIVAIKRPAGPVCAPSRGSGYEWRGQTVWNYISKWYRFDRVPRGDAHVSIVHYFDDCNRLGGGHTCDDAQRLSVTMEMIEAFKLKTCQRCSDRMKTVMPAVAEEELVNAQR